MEYRLSLKMASNPEQSQYFLNMSKRSRKKLPLLPLTQEMYNKIDKNLLKLKRGCYPNQPKIFSKGFIIRKKVLNSRKSKSEENLLKFEDDESFFKPNIDISLNNQIETDHQNKENDSSVIYEFSRSKSIENILSDTFSSNEMQFFDDSVCENLNGSNGKKMSITDNLADIEICDDSMIINETRFTSNFELQTSVNYSCFMDVEENSNVLTSTPQHDYDDNDEYEMAYNSRINLINDHVVESKFDEEELVNENNQINLSIEFSLNYSFPDDKPLPTENEDFNQNKSEEYPLIPLLCSYNLNQDNSKQYVSEMILNEVETHENDDLCVTLSVNDVTKDRSDFLIEKIEKIMLDLMTKIMNNSVVTIKILKSLDKRNLTYSNNIVQMKALNRCYTKYIGFRSKKRQHHFTVIIFLLGEIFKLLNSDSNTTTRELYYKKTEFLTNQNCLANGIRDICALLEAEPWELAIYNSSKALLAGNITITTSNDYQINYRNINSGISIPGDITQLKKIETDAKFVIIVEKDTVFQRLLSDGIFKRLNEKFILLTARGYPDVNSRWLLKRIWDEFHLQTYILVDADPHGIEIMCTYKYGSMKLAQHANALAMPTIKWLGVHPSEIQTLCLNSIPMTDNDHRKITSLLNRTYVSDDIKTELQILSSLDEKCEIESLTSLFHDTLIDIYIPSKLRL